MDMTQGTELSPGPIAVPPRVSIGLPVFNGERFLAEAVESLLAQGFRDFELIISDNASTDRTGEICRRMAERDPRIRYLRQVRNIGAPANFTHVFDEARGDFFMWAAADDVWSANWLATILPLVEQEGCLGFGTVVSIGPDGEVLDLISNHRDLSFGGSRLVRRMRFFLQPGRLGKPNLIYGLFPRRAASEWARAAFRTQRWGADMLALYELLGERAAAGTPDAVMHKRMHEDCLAAPVRLGRLHSPWSRMIAAMVSVLREPMLGEYLERGTLLERCLLVALYPIAIFRVLWNRLTVWRRSR